MTCFAFLVAVSSSFLSLFIEHVTHKIASVNTCNSIDVFFFRVLALYLWLICMESSAIICNVLF